MRKTIIFATIPTLILTIYISLSSHGQDAQKPVTRFQYQTRKFLYEEKCSKCHALERVFAEPKTENEWRICITRMMRKNSLWITPEESAQIIDEILGTKQDVITTSPQSKRYDNTRLLFVDRCTKCHTVTQILNKNKTQEEWKETILRMRDNAPELFMDEDIPILADYLTERGELMRDDVAATIMVDKCLICHEWGRILLEQKSKKDWERCVTDMRELARGTLKKDWFTYDEFKLIVDLLVKTQGLEIPGS